MSWVRVPVLSVQSTSMAPKFCTELSRFTTTLRLAMATAPRARLAETIIGSISGVSPTATASAKVSADIQSPLLTPLSIKTMGTITSMKRISSLVTLFTPRSKLVSMRLWLTTLRASEPK